MLRNERKCCEWARNRGSGSHAEWIQGPEEDTPCSKPRTHSTALLSWWPGQGPWLQASDIPPQAPCLQFHPPRLETDGLQLMALPQLSAQVTQASAHSFKKLRETLHHLYIFIPSKILHHNSKFALLGDENREKSL